MEVTWPEDIYTVGSLAAAGQESQDARAVLFDSYGSSREFMMVRLVVCLSASRWW